MSTARDYIDGAFKDDKDAEVGIDGFTLLARVRDRTTQTADVPTTFLEDGTHVNDHIILNPITISIDGNVSDVHLKPSEAIAAIREAQNQVGVITQYLPSRTVSQISRISGLISDFTNAVDFVDSVVASAESLGGYLGNEDPEQGNIKKFLANMDSIRNSKRLIEIGTEYKTYKNMVITSIEITKDNQENAISFTLEAQQFRFAVSLVAIAVPNPNPSSATNGQTGSETDKGIQDGENVLESAASQLKGAFGL
jgi:hypothetical protein